MVIYFIIQDHDFVFTVDNYPRFVLFALWFTVICWVMYNCIDVAVNKIRNRKAYIADNIIDTDCTQEKESWTVPIDNSCVVIREEISGTQHWRKFLIEDKETKVKIVIAINPKGEINHIRNYDSHE